MNDEEPLKPIIEMPGTSELETETLQRLAWLMDRAFTIPGTPIKVGLDAILGLIPVGGDVLTGFVQTGIVMVAMTHYRVPKAVAARMAANVLLDVAVGSIPLVGDMFDVAFKANTKNVKLLLEVQQKRSERKPVSSLSSILYIIAIAAVLLGAVTLVAIGFVTVVRHLFLSVTA